MSHLPYTIIIRFHRFKPEEEERPIMSKILSYGYQRDWHDKKNDWDKEQKKFAQVKFFGAPKN